MRIIEDHYQDEQREYEITCPHCRSKLAYTFNDITHNESGDKWIYCGVCGGKIFLSDNNKTPTIDTIQYPRDFLSFPDDLPVTTNIEDTKINEWIKECINDLDKDNNFSYNQCGDTMVFAFVFETDESLPVADVVVTKNFREAVVKIPRKNF